MLHAKDSLFSGWRLTGLIAVLLLVMTLLVAGASPNTVEAARAVIRMTARTSLILFFWHFRRRHSLRFGLPALRNGCVQTAAMSACHSPYRTSSTRSRSLPLLGLTRFYSKASRTSDHS